MTGWARGAFLALVALTALAYVAASLSADVAWATVFDNIQWTLAFGVSAWLAWRGVARSAVAERPLRQGLFLGAALIFLGQLVWIVQEVSGRNPFPAPADGLFLLAAVTWIASWLQALVQGLDKKRMGATLLDIGGALSALLAATLMLYLPSQADMDFLRLLVLVLYPVLFLLAAGLSFFVVPALGLRASGPHGLVLAGITGYGLSWMHWNLLALEGALAAGSLHHISFTVSALLLGWGAHFIRLEPGKPDSRWSRRTLAYLPLGAMALALLTLAVQFLRLNETAGLAQHVIFFCCVLALLFTSLRQTLVVGLLERLREAENAILRNEADMYQLANFDALTGLPNRRMFEDRLAQALREAEPRQGRVAVLIVDLDHFRQINDSFGHQYGDVLLKEVGTRLQSCVPTHGSLARLGGDEFMLMLEWVTSRTDVAALSQSLLQALSRSAWDDVPARHFISASIGISLYPDDAADAVELLRNADAALNEAKSAGRGAYRFYIEAYTEATRRKLELRNRLHTGLSRGEFHLVYQPQLDARRRLVGLEALLRWTLDGRPVSPSEFIPVAEDSGLIVALGEWVFAEVCRQVAQWRALGLTVPVVSVNVSARQLLGQGLVNTFTGMAASAGLQPASLMLEVTESQLLDERMLPCAEALHAAGFALSMDDFGTGQSSLVKLKKLPIRELKIDKEFVKDIDADPDDRQICATIHALAATLDLEVVAEGVETEAQFELLVAMGCQRFQGWFFAPALPPAVIEKDWLLAR